MKIRDILNEFIDDMPTGIRVKGQDITYGDIKNFGAEMGLTPDEIIDLARTAKDISQDTITNPITGTEYKTTDVISKGLNLASVLPFVKSGKLLSKARKFGTRQAASKGVEKLAKTVGGIDFAAPGMSKDSADLLKRKKAKFIVGDRITVKINDEKFKVPVIGITPTGYVVDLSDIPGKKKGEKMLIPDNVTESSSATVTSGNIASLGNSPHVAAGTPAVLKRWSGEPGSSGTTGKSIKHKPMKSQSAKDNPVTNPNVGNNLIA